MRALHSIAVVASILAVSSLASANGAGIGGFSGKTGGSCGTCHNGGTAPTVALDGPKTLAAGQSGDYTLVVTTGAAKASAGVAGSDGVKLVAGTGLKDQAGELVQSAALATAEGKASFTFKVTAPSTGDKLTIFAAGLASDGTAATGDAHATTKLEVTVTGGAAAPASTAPAKDDKTDKPKKSTTTKTGDDDDDNDAAKRDPFAADPTGCSMTHGEAGTSAGALVLALLVMASGARRRTSRRPR